MKDKIEQLYISAIQGEWDSAYFAERMMELMLPYVDLTKLNQDNYTEVQVASFNASETGLMFWTPDGMKTSEEYKKIIEENNRGWQIPPKPDNEGLKLDLNIPI